MISAFEKGNWCLLYCGCCAQEAAEQPDLYGVRRSGRQRKEVQRLELKPESEDEKPRRGRRGRGGRRSTKTSTYVSQSWSGFLHGEEGGGGVNAYANVLVNGWRHKNCVEGGGGKKSWKCCVRTGCTYGWPLWRGIVSYEKPPVISCSHDFRLKKTKYLS